MNSCKRRRHKVGSNLEHEERANLDRGDIQWYKNLKYKTLGMLLLMKGQA